MVATQHISRHGTAVMAEVPKKTSPVRGRSQRVTSHNIPSDERVSGQIERERIMRGRVLIAKPPELEFQLTRARRTIQVPERRQSRVVSDLVAMGGWQTGGGGDRLGVHSASARYNIQSLLAVEPARVALIIVRVRGKNSVRNHIRVGARPIDSVTHLKASSMSTDAVRRMVRRNDQGLALPV